MSENNIFVHFCIPRGRLCKSVRAIGRKEFCALGKTKLPQDTGVLRQ